MSDDSKPVLTTASTVQCGHGGGVHLGTGAAKLLVQGKPVLLAGDVVNQDVGPDCGTQPSPSTKKCTKVLSVTQGIATKLRVNKKGILREDLKGVLREDLHGTTDGSPPGTLAASSGQSKLKTK